MEIREITEKEFNKEVIDCNERVLVDFYANWCGPCKMIRPILEEISKNNTIKIVSINVDEAPDLASEYGVMSIPCLILFEGHKEVARSVGLKSKEELESFIEEK